MMCVKAGCKSAIRLNKESIPSRAYIAFKTQEQVALFSREYDGHIFRDKNGRFSPWRFNWLS